MMWRLFRSLYVHNMSCIFQKLTPANVFQLIRRSLKVVLYRLVCFWVILMISLCEIEKGLQLHVSVTFSQIQCPLHCMSTCRWFCRKSQERTEFKVSYMLFITIVIFGILKSMWKTVQEVFFILVEVLGGWFWGHKSLPL